MGTNVVGRDTQLDRIGRFVSEIPLGPSALILSGEAGIGKTTLWKHGLSDALASSRRVLQCRPVESEAQLSFTAILDLFEGVLDHALLELPTPQRVALEAALFRAAPVARPPDWSALSVGTLSLLRVVARSEPVVVAVDDEQWVDPSSARLLKFVFSRLRDEPVGVLIGLRSGTDATDPFGLQRAFEPSRLAVLDLGPLDLASTGRLLHERLHGGFSMDALRRIHQLSRGNPFFALEIARATLRSDSAARPRGFVRLPDHLFDLVRDRVRRLPTGTVNVLRLVASMSQPTVSIIEAAAGGKGQSASALLKAVDAGVIEVEEGRIRFAHPLLGSAIYGGMSPPVRRKAHRRLSEVLDDAEERGRHLALAGSAPDAVIAATLEAAAQEARTRGAFETAAQLLEDSGQYTPPGDKEEAWRRLLTAIECHMLGGEMHDSRVLAERLLSILPAGVWRARVLWVLGRLHTSNSMTSAAGFFEQALPQSEGDAWLEASILISLAWAAHYSALPDLPSAASYAERALERAELLGDRALLTRALEAVAGTHFFLGRGDALDVLARAIAMEEGLEWLVLGYPNFFYANVLRWTDRLDEARSLFGTLRERAVEFGDSASVSEIDYHLCELECWAGNWRAALASAHEMQSDAWMWSSGSAMSSVPCVALTALALAEAHLGLVEEARANGLQALASASQHNEMHFVVRALSILGFLELSVGDAEAANRYLGQIGPLVCKMGEPGVFRFCPDHIEALIALDRTTEAKDVLERFEDQGRELDRAWVRGTAARCRASLLASLGDIPGAIQAAGNALEEHERLPMPFELGRTLLVLGAIERRAKHKRAARESLGRALEIFDRLGAPLWSKRAGAELARIGGRAPAPDALTATEDQVAELVAVGCTNKEVAAALFMSVRTVDANLRRIYSKLGVRSRTELAVARTKVEQRR